MNNDYQLNSQNEYLGITEAAEYLRISASTLRRWEKKGFLVPERTPTGIRRYTKKQLDDVIQAPTDIHSYSSLQSHGHSAPLAASIGPANSSDVNTYVLEEDNVSDLAWNTISSPEIAVEIPVNNALNVTTLASSTTELIPNITPPPDEVDQLRDFFKRAGYDSVPTIEPMKPFPTASIQPPPSAEHPASTISTPIFYNPPKVSGGSAFIDKSPFESLSIGDTTHDSAATNESSVELSELLSAQNFRMQTDHGTLPVETFVPRDSLPFKQSARPRIEVFHEEQSSSLPTTEYNIAKSLPLEENVRQSANVPQSDAVGGASKENSYHVTQKNETKKVNRLPLVLVSIVLFVLLSLGGWFVFSALSTPEPLYSPIID